MTPDQFANDVLDLSLAVTKVVVAISPALVALAPVVLPRLAASFRNKRHGQAFEAVSRMGLLATNVAATEIRAGLGRAAALDSPGGPAITKDEMAAIMLKAAAAAFDWAKEQKVLPQVLAVYGGEEAVTASISAIIHDKLSGSPVGPPPPEPPKPIMDAAAFLATPPPAAPTLAQIAEKQWNFGPEKK